MPYYCTVPRCTSMAGKAKNVSFHQFPRDEELARLWNKILKRGKPYTKYSKVCSLHFRPEDYTITSVGKNKGQWRTLRKDAIPSQNLPSESPGPTTQRSRSSGAWVPSLPPNVMDTRMQQQMAQAIYMQTMLAMQAATNGTPSLPIPSSVSSSIANTSNPPISEIEKLLQIHTHKNGIEQLHENDEEVRTIKPEGQTSYKCEECSKCFKDPDVYILHKRTHIKKEILSIEKENHDANSGNRQETLRANPILANLLKSGMPNDIPDQLPNNFNNGFEINNILSIENQIMTALAANMENYIRNLTMLTQTPKEENGYSDTGEDNNENDFDENSDSNDHQNDQNHHVNNIDHENERLVTNIQESNIEICKDSNINEKVGKENDKEGNPNEKYGNVNETEGNLNEKHGYVNETEGNLNEKYGYVNLKGLEGSAEVIKEPNCDKEDLNELKDSNSLVIDEIM